MKDDVITITSDIFGEFTNLKTSKIEVVQRFTLKTNCLVVQVISYGATIISIQAPDKHGKFDDVVLGFDDMKGYRSKINPYFGATVGRYANRVGNATFKLDGETFQLPENAPGCSLHGGLVGFDKVNWTSSVEKDRLIFTHVSTDGDQGYPGDLLATVVYRIVDGNRLEITFEAVSAKKTIVNLTNHSYYNLAGHHSGTEGVYNHHICINADKITVLNDKMTATGKYIMKLLQGLDLYALEVRDPDTKISHISLHGELKNVGGTAYDLRISKNIGQAIKELSENGFDFNYCLNNYTMDETKHTIRLAARVVEPNSGRYLEVHTDQPGVQFYTGNFLENVPGKKNAVYNKHSAFCLETQTYPNSINISSFPNSTLKPGEKYLHRVWYTFGVHCS